MEGLGGRIRRERKAVGLTLEQLANAGAVVKPHHDKGYEWIYIIKGECIFEYSGLSHELKGGDVIYYDARKTHSVNILTPLESIDIFIRT